jgi:hypothetical protein
MMPVNIQFVLTGFTQDAGARVFTFEGITAGRTRLACSVRADLAVARRYGIPMQELPLLCRRLLERRDEAETRLTLTFTEDEMRVYSDERAAARTEAAHRRKPPKRPAGETPGAAWRGPQPR